VAALWAYKTIVGIITVVTKAWSVITKIMTAIQTAFNAVMSLNPVMLVYIAILALITVFVVLWNKSEAFRNFFINMWKGIKKTVADVGNFFKNGINNVVNFFKKAGSDIKVFFTGVGNWISNTFSTAKEKVITAFTAVGDFFVGVKDGIINAFSNVGEKIGNFVDGAKERIVSGFSAAKETVVGIFDTLGDVLKAPINVAVEAINAVIRGVNKISWDVPDYVPGIGGTTFGFNISEIPKLAKGTIGNERTPDTFIAGEKGAELIIGAKGREVLNHRETNGFFRNIINGINNFKKGENGDILSGFVDALKGGILPKTSTISTLTESTVNNKIIKQYNNFSNTFNGDKDIQKTANSAMENAEENVVDRLKRALEYS
jgi:phage-related protein